MFITINHNLQTLACCHYGNIDISVSLPNLKTLEQTIHAYNFMDTLIQILTRLPDLESLHLIIPKDACVLKYWKLDDAETMRVLTHHLKKVKFLEFDEEKPKLDLACALLEHGHALEEMVFNWGDETSIYLISNRVMKESKLANASEGESDGVDMISKLPDDILELILSRIPSTEELTRTSILSRRWSFRLWCASCYNMSTIRRWIHAAVVRKVKLLDMLFRPIDDSVDIEMPDCLVACASLEVLRLHLMRGPLSVPKFTGFSALRVLELNDVDLLKNDLVKYFLESCPLLEDLSLIDCPAYSLVISSPMLKNLRIDTQELVDDDGYSEEGLDIDWAMCLSLEISCPKLVCLTLTGYVATEFLFNNLCSLKKAVIYAEELFEVEEPIYDLFYDMRHVESLSISLRSVEQMGFRDEDDPISLPNLKTLELTVDALHVLIRFLTCLPDLEYLHLVFPKNVYGLDKWNQDEATPETMSILTRHLKKVEFLEFQENKPELNLARSLLEHGKELEEMVFSWSDEAKFHERSMETMNQVSEFHKASSAVKLTGFAAVACSDWRETNEIVKQKSLK
ncbi:unnamed protein product [Lactuca saligna]|uniref:F-box domain-containing protein n=1 Tax=Lactuca saligna TaxID=75948 RepID=A0AA35ZHR9_LACSI|nr:unnamed protein product [Lactuca saligna]